jgi:DNA transposition AAA+ family ATPase
MNNIKKEQIVNALYEYCERYESQAKAAHSLKDVSSATISQMLNRKWELISDEMWRNVASQIGYKENRWELVETTDHKLLKFLLNDAKENALAMAICGHAGSGKSFTISHFQRSNRNVFVLSCNEFWNKKSFMQELLMSIGRDYKGMGISEMMNEITSTIKRLENPLIVLDEADKLTDAVLYLFITLYNKLEDECGIVLCATNHLEKHLKRGVLANKKGYNEIWSRIGRKCIMLKGVTAADIVAVCEANGVTDTRIIQDIISDSESDFRRVKRRVHAIARQGTAKNGDFIVTKNLTPSHTSPPAPSPWGEGIRGVTEPEFRHPKKPEA